MEKKNLLQQNYFDRYFIKISIHFSLTLNELKGIYNVYILKNRFIK